ncbi:MAG: lipase maturation factor family protein, partial [bacterium]|nr:lipase maturation factor family protein [bacterium]
DHPPTYLRARLYEYKFTTSEEKAQTGHWWKRTLTDEYLPVVHRSPIDN